MAPILKIISACILLIACSLSVSAQKEEDELIEIKVGGKVLLGQVIDGDTVYFYTLKQAKVVGKRYYKTKKRTLSYARLKYYVRKVYPYARLATQKIEMYDEVIANAASEREKKVFLRQAEKKLKEEFADHIRNLTRIQGMLFIKLIHRETGRTVHEILKDYRGGWSAASWQTVAKMFGEDLKDTYKPESSDALVEEIVQMIEQRKLAPMAVPEKVLTKKELRERRKQIRKKMRDRKKSKKKKEKEDQTKS